MNMDTNRPEANLDEMKQIKIQLSKRHHVVLHSLKILTGRTISEITAEALDRYYDAEGIEQGIGAKTVNE